MIGVATAAALVIVVGYPVHSPPSTPEGLTFDEVARDSNSLVRNLSGGPWILTSALGIVSANRLWFDPIGDEVCRNLPGITVWNASRLPTAPDQLATGFAPFWSLIYMNAGRALIDVTSFDNALHASGVILPSSPCGSWIGQVVGNFTATPVLDSPSAAARAWSIDGQSYSSANPNAFEFYETGGGQLPFWGSTVGGWIVGYQLCGLPGYMGATTTQTDELKFQNLSGPYESIYSTGACTLSGYQIAFGSPSNSSIGTAVQTALSLSVGFANTPNATSGWGLITASVQLALVNSSTGMADPVSSPSCTGMNLTAGTCGLPSSWYAALTNANGYWLDVYGNFNGQAGWLLPNVPFYSGDSLVVVHAPFVPAGGFELSLGPTSSSVQVVGAVTI